MNWQAGKNALRERYSNEIPEAESEVFLSDRKQVANKPNLSNPQTVQTTKGHCA